VVDIDDSVRREIGGVQRIVDRTSHDGIAGIDHASPKANG
jgi:hypothetical protein